MIIKKIDKKKDRQLIIQHKQKLLQQLKETAEPALLLHLTALVLYTAVSGCILHASGKFVSQILGHIRPSLNEQQNALLMQYHGKFFEADLLLLCFVHFIFAFKIWCSNCCKPMRKA